MLCVATSKLGEYNAHVSFLPLCCGGPYAYVKVEVAFDNWCILQ